MAAEPATAVARSPQPAQPGEKIGELVKVALDIAGSLQPREVIARILERGTHAVQADRATLSSLVDDHVVVEATYGRAGELTWVGQRYSRDYFAGQPLVQKAIDTLQPAFGGRLAADQAAPEFRQALASVRHVAVIPLVHGDRAIGMLVLSRYEDRPFTQADLAALSLLGTISGLALRNARLYEEGEAARARADQTAARMRAAVEAAEDVASQLELDQVLGRLVERAAASVGADGTSLARLEGAEMQAMQEAVTRARPRAELVKGVLQIDPGTDMTVLADSVMVGKILDNLLNNALTYADHPPTIRLGARRDADQVAVTIADDGSRISPADQTRIFTRFARGADKLSLEKPGSGLGLYLSRGLAERMGGSLQLQPSQPNKGSTFLLRLPAS